ncbi:uncharacterized protein LOC117398677 [Acipenser ruthenus]|uniref:uncharacterized protein LOC117398677 n=1 Tax=Acipenser ruthenus TaxID=7906 RepID=UPI0027412A2D|nr:uncharacterized protein LOC117398677 [Acipenser ruthenus]
MAYLNQESPNGFVPQMHVSWVSSGLFHTIGQMMSTDLVQGGEPPAFLARCVVDYILTGDVMKVCVNTDDIPDTLLRESLKKIEQSTDDSELEEVLQLCDSWRFTVPNPVTMTNRLQFVRIATLYTVILQRQSCLNQIMDGLAYYEVLQLLRKKPCMRSLLDGQSADSGAITAESVINLLKPSYSVLGSNRRQREEILVVKFRDILHSIQDKELGDRLKDRELTEAEKDFVNALRLGHILAFATGSSTIPAMGFNPNPKLSFSHDEAKVHPIAHTCANELQLFVNNRTLANNDEFEYIILAALMNGAVFSTV